MGWKTIFSQPEDWIQYNTVDFGAKKLKTVSLKARAQNGGVLQIRLNSLSGPLLAEIKIPANNDWSVIDTKLKYFDKGIQNLVVKAAEDQLIEVDWLSFK